MRADSGADSPSAVVALGVAGFAVPDSLARWPRTDDDATSPSGGSHIGGSGGSGWDDDGSSRSGGGRSGGPGGMTIGTMTNSVDSRLGRMNGYCRETELTE